MEHINYLFDCRSLASAVFIERIQKNNKDFKDSALLKNVFTLFLTFQTKTKN